MRQQLLSLLVGMAAVSGLVQAGNLADAAAGRDFATVRRLIGERANPSEAQADGTTALHWAAHWNDLEAVRALLKAGGDAKAMNRFGATPLSEAAAVGNAPMMDCTSR